MRTFHIPGGNKFKKPIKCDCANAGDTDVYVIFSKPGELLYDPADGDAFMTSKDEPLPHGSIRVGHRYGPYTAYKDPRVIKYTFIPQKSGRPIKFEIHIRMDDPHCRDRKELVESEQGAVR